MRRLVIMISSAVIVLPIVAGIAFKVLLQRQAESMATQLIERLQSVASLTYRHLSVGLNGTLTFEDINLIPQSLGESLSASALKIHTPGVFFVLQGKPLWDKNALPTRLGVTLQHLQFPMDPAPWIQKIPVPALNHPIAACYYNPEHFSKRIKAETLRGDITLSYEFEPAAQAARLSMRFSVPNLMSLDADVKLGAVEPVWPQLLAWFQNKPGIQPVTIRYQDWLSESILNECAEKNQLALGDYVAQLATLERAIYFQLWGFYPGEALRQGWKDFLLNPPHELIMSITPARQLDIAVLSTYKIPDLLTLLQLNVTVNGNPVADLAFELPVNHPGVLPDMSTYLKLSDALFAPPTPSSTSESPSVAAAPTAIPAGETPEESLQPRYVPKYYVVSIASLDQYLGKKIKLYLADQAKPREGWLQSIASDQLILERKMGAGAAVSEIPLARIQQVEVFLKKPPQAP